jgi:Helicase HerA-like C-terminal/Type IV secretion-system coupling protein DNA-binding domain
VIFRRRDIPAPAPPRFVGEADGERGVVIAQRIGGEPALPSDRGMVLLSPARLCRHLIVCGATGSGKTETLLRLAWTLARSGDAQVFYLDGKGDRHNAQRFVALMADAGREARVFPNEPIDGWRGEAHEIQGRLMEIVDYATDGPAAWYRDIAKNVLRLACEHPDGPPRSSGEALARMDLTGLRRAHRADEALAALKPEQVSQVRLRYAAFFGQTRGALDGDWAWDEHSCAYLLLDSLALRDETRGLTRYLLEDFAHYFTTRKPRERLCLLIVDEFSALAEGSEMATRIEQARGFNTAIVLAPQVIAGMGDEEQTARILGCVETVICHRVNAPEQIVDLAGTRKVVEYSTHYAEEGLKRQGSARVQHQYKVDPNHVRSLPVGWAYVISRGRAMKVHVLAAPDVRAELPKADLLAKEDHRVPAGKRQSEELAGLPF